MEWNASGFGGGGAARIFVTPPRAETRDGGSGGVEPLTSSSLLPLTCAAPSSSLFPLTWAVPPSSLFPLTWAAPPSSLLPLTCAAPPSSLLPLARAVVLSLLFLSMAGSIFDRALKEAAAKRAEVGDGVPHKNLAS